MYGMNDKKYISKGFLTTECAIQFKLFDTPITFWNSKLQNKMVWKYHIYYIKIGIIRILFTVFLEFSKCENDTCTFI